MTTTDRIESTFPGEVLMEGFGVTLNELAVSIGVPPRSTGHYRSDQVNRLRNVLEFRFTV